MLQRKLRDEDEKLRALTPKEREEVKKTGIRLTGLQSLLPLCSVTSVVHRSPTV